MCALAVEGARVRFQCVWPTMIQEISQPFMCILQLELEQRRYFLVMHLKLFYHSSSYHSFPVLLQDNFTAAITYYHKVNDQHRSISLCTEFHVIDIIATRKLGCACGWGSGKFPTSSFSLVITRMEISFLTFANMTLRTEKPKEK